MASRDEAVVLAAKSLTSTGRLDSTMRLFNASLTFRDGAGTPHPYLADALPRLNSESWRVFPDGTMETIYRLRPGLAWHDGTSLTADDFVFAWRVYTAPGLGLFTPAPQDQIQSVEAPDSQTIAISWRTPYPDAGALKNRDLDPLPRHLLQPSFAVYEQNPAAERDVFANLPYWTMDYVAAGPYRLERWEPGSHLSTVAFERHALGRPKIDRIVLRLIADENIVLTNVLAESVHVAATNALRFEHAAALKSSWGTSKRGVVLVEAASSNATMVQFRPEYQRTPELLDLRVRRALAHSIDREALNEGLFDGEGLFSASYVNPNARYYGEVERSVEQYSFDLRAMGELMSEAGLLKGPGGLYVNAGGEPLRPHLLGLASTHGAKTVTIMADVWKRAGLDVQSSILPAAQSRDFEARATFPGMHNTNVNSSQDALNFFAAAQVGSPANRWGGNNRGGWVNAEFERLSELYRSTLDRDERDRQFVQMMVLLSQALPTIKNYFNVEVFAHLSELRGPAPGTPDTLTFWNIHEWELR
jgi:peptide/nickel transport system substrate-binding protein